MKQVSGQMSLFDLDMPCGKTSPAPSLPTKGRTSVSSSKSFAKSKTKEPMFLDLSGGGGNLVGVSWETGIPWHGASSTLNFGEFPNVVEESGLWQILEANVPQKYFLSETACLGVLRRAERRGKQLPEILEKALKQQIERWRKYGSPLPVFTVSAVEKSIVCYNGDAIGNTAKCLDQTSAKPYCNQGANIVLECYDARGNGDGETVPTITGDHNSRITDYTAVVCEKYAANSSSDGISGTLDMNYYKGVGSRQGKEREFVVFSIDRAAFNQGKNAQYDIGIDESGIAQTVVAKGPGAVCYEIGNGQVDETGLHSVCGALNCMHDPKAVLYPVYCLQGNGIDRADTAGCNGKGVTENVSYTLNTVDRHAVCCEAEGHTHEEVVRMREGKDGGGKGALVQEDKSGTIACNNDQVLFQKAETQYIVRRLTPLECCRLQGMPGFWTDGVEGSDAARYKLWGNGMALPNALYVMEGIAEAESRRRNKNGIL